jgi:hypothetical protein
MESTYISKEKSEVSQVKEPTIIFLFDMKNWYETINPLSKVDLLDIVPLVSTHFYIDFGINAYVLILTKSKWDELNKDLKKKFMFISRRIKEEMEGPVTSIQRERYENSDIFELLMSQQPADPVESVNINLDTIIENDEEEIQVPE